MIVLKAAQEKFLGALQAVSGIVERRHTLPILANVLVRKTGGTIEFTTSDLEIQVRTSAELGGDSSNFATTVGARKLIDILRSMPSDQTVTLSATQSKLTLAGGKSRFTLQTMPADDFPLVQESADFGPMFSVPQKTLKNLIAQVHFAMAVHDIRYYLNGILFVAEGKSLTLVATDGHRLALAQATLETEIPKQEVILPRKTVLELQRLLKDDEHADRDALRAEPGQVLVRRHGVRLQARRGQVPRLQPRHPEEPQEPGHARTVAAAAEPAARRDPDQRQVQGRSRQHRARHPAHRVVECRAGRGDGGARDRLRRRRHRDRLQRHLPDRRARQHGPGDGHGRAAGHQLERADHRARTRPASSTSSCRCGSERENTKNPR